MLNKQVVIINGSGGVGKTTFEKLVCKYCNAYIYSSIDKVKEIAKVCGWKGEKTEKARKFLSDLKELTSDYNDMAFNDLKEIVQDFQSNLLLGNILFLDIREPKDIKRAKKEFNAITVLIKNDNVKHITSNIADKNVYDFDYNYVIDNSGTLRDLEEKAKWFVKQLMKENINLEKV